MKYTEKVYLTRSPMRTNVKSSPKGLSAAIDYRYWGGKLLQIRPHSCSKSLPKSLQNHLSRSSSLEALLQAQCMKSLRERVHLIVRNLLKLLYFTVVLDISQCSHATPTILLTDMKTCVRDLMFDPETIQNCVENQCRKPS